MGLFDKLKGKVKGAIQGEQAAPPAPAPPPPVAAPVAATAPPDNDDDDERADGPLDTAGFDPEHDEGAFWAAGRQMDSDGEGGGTDASRAEIMQRYGIRDRSHWRAVKEACDKILERKYGSYEAALQQYTNWLMADMQRNQQAKIDAARTGPLFQPVEGISLEVWASKNAAIVGGANYEDVIKGAGYDRARWDRANAEWNARMSKDTTFAIATVYGNAFQAASQGKYAANVRDAIAARAENRDLGVPLPVTYEQFFDIMMEQSFAFLAGKDPVETLKGLQLTVVDWTDLGTVMGYQLTRYGVRDHAQINTASAAAKASAQARWPAVDGSDVDIKF